MAQTLTINHYDLPGWRASPRKELMMNGWHTIKKVRTELSEALRLAKHGQNATAHARVWRARELLDKYCKESRGPKYGFEAETLGS
jgi:hypothetical protein